MLPGSAGNVSTEEDCHVQVIQMSHLGVGVERKPPSWGSMVSKAETGTLGLLLKHLLS